MVAISHIYLSEYSHYMRGKYYMFLYELLLKHLHIKHILFLFFNGRVTKKIVGFKPGENHYKAGALMLMLKRQCVFFLNILKIIHIGHIVMSYIEGIQNIQ